ncbi:MAG: hypothetical protein WA860_03365 [Acidimicrobiales bacterium]|jgi:hypothetical protein
MAFLRRARRRSAIAVALSLLTLIAAAEIPAASAASSGFEALIGKTLPKGELPANNPTPYLAIANPYIKPKNLDGTAYPPLVVDNSSGDWVAFWDFKNAKTAAAFYEHPPANANILREGIQAWSPIKGSTGVPGRTQLLDERECLWSGGAGQGGASGKGTPSGGKLESSRKCSVGTASSIGVTTDVLIGKVVVIDSNQSGVPSVIGGPGNPSNATENVLIAKIAISLLAKVGIH